MWQYRLDFFAAPLAVFILAIVTCRSGAWFAWAAGGFVLFGLLEYLIHRFVLHGCYWHANHQRHHTHPSEPTIFAWYFVPAIMAGFFIALPYAVFAGFLVGYVWFTVWHFALHQWDLEKHPLVQRYARWHLVHHADAPFNYGISHPFFDLMFGTYVSAERWASTKRAQRANRE